MLTTSLRTDIGKVRRVNEDAVLWEPELGFMAIADGMGGHNAGDVAASIAVEAVRGFVQNSASGNDFTWPFGIDPKLSFDANRVVTAVKIANRRVFRAAEERAAYGGMGTTMVAALIDGAHLTFSSIGDSRLYTVVDSELRLLTRDDSWIVMLTEQSGLDASAFEKHPLRHVLTSVVGARPELDVKIQEIDLVDGQLLMLSTDGLHETVPRSAIEAVLLNERDLERAADTLVDDALGRGGRDNITLLLGRFQQ